MGAKPTKVQRRLSHGRVCEGMFGVSEVVGVACEGLSDEVGDGKGDQAEACHPCRTTALPETVSKEQDRLGTPNPLAGTALVALERLPFVGESCAGPSSTGQGLRCVHLDHESSRSCSVCLACIPRAG